MRISTRASVLATLGRIEEAKKQLQRLKNEHLLSPQTLIVEAGLRLRQGKISGALKSLEKMVSLTRGSLVLIPAANLLASIGRQDLSYRALERLEPAIARSPRVLRLIAMLSTFPKQGKTQEGASGSFRYVAAKETPTKAIDGVLRLFKRARRFIDARIGRLGPKPVTLYVVYTLGEHPWGYYDAVNRRIVCRGDFRDAGRGKDALLEHLARHEYAHLAFDALVRRPGEGVVPYPRWMVEGVADQLAGGIEYLGKFGYHLGRLDSEPLSGEGLARILSAPVLGMGKISQEDQARAYAQSYEMVGKLLELIGTRKSWLRLAAFVRRLSQGKDLNQELLRQFGTQVKVLSEVYRKVQRKRQRRETGS
jgi:tetratricopeptide (TPR) repeat protein